MVKNIPMAIMIFAFLLLFLHCNLVLIDLKRGLGGGLRRISTIILNILCIGSVVFGSLMYLSVVPGAATTALAFTIAGCLVSVIVSTNEQIQATYNAQ